MADDLTSSSSLRKIGHGRWLRYISYFKGSFVSILILFAIAYSLHTNISSIDRVLNYVVLQEYNLSRSQKIQLHQIGKDQLVTSHGTHHSTSNREIGNGGRESISNGPKNSSSDTIVVEVLDRPTPKENNEIPRSHINSLHKNFTSSSMDTTETVKKDSASVATPKYQDKKANFKRGTQNGRLRLKHGTSTTKKMEGEVLGIRPRAFEPWPVNKPFPCFEAGDAWMSQKTQLRPSKTGLLFFKPYKTGSSTGSGINLRISKNVAKLKGFNMCISRFGHGPSDRPGYRLFHNRSRDKSILWTVIREPTARAVSSFFHFDVSRDGIEPTNENFKKHVTSVKLDYYLDALYTKRKFRGRHKSNPIRVSNSILNDFNFIGITERMDESAVALMMLMNLKMADILYLSAKKNGGYDDGGGENGCTIIKPSFVSPEMKDFFVSKEWKDRMKYDLALYKAANRSLDMTIDALGRKRFEENLVLFKRAQDAATNKCVSKTKFPCYADGYKRPPNQTDCIWSDSGCGTECLDRVATELSLW